MKQQMERKCEKSIFVVHVRRFHGSLMHPLYICCMGALSKLQSFLLQQQTFLEKCETWMEFLVQTEENLAVEISGNYQSLMEQQKAHEVRISFLNMLAEHNVNYSLLMVNALSSSYSKLRCSVDSKSYTL